jgi:hypothetical protein
VKRSAIWWAYQVLTAACIFGAVYTFLTILAGVTL